MYLVNIFVCLCSSAEYIAPNNCNESHQNDSLNLSGHLQAHNIYPFK